MKKILIIIALIAVLGIGFFFAWPYIQENIGGSRTGTLPPPGANNSAGSGLAPLSLKAIFAYWLTTQGDIITLQENGVISQIVNGQEEVLTDQAIPDLQSAIASPDGKFALISFGPRLAPTVSLFDVLKKVWQPLPQGTTAAAWDPVGTRIAYLKTGGEPVSLILYDVKTKKSTEILRFHEEGLSLSWAQSGKIYLSEAPSAKTGSSLWAFDINQRSLTQLFSNMPGFIVSWAPGGKTALTFTNNFHENALAIINDKGQTLNQLTVTTLPSKCIFGNNTTLYCAVPRALPAGTILPDDYLKHKIYTEDDILKFDLASSTASVLYDGNTGAVDATQLKIQNNKLSFVNRYDRNLYSLEINK